MSREEAEALATELARDVERRCVEIGHPLAVLSPTVEGLCHEAILRALSSVRPPSRIESAERALVEAALAWRDAETGKRKQPLTNGDSDALDALLRQELEAVDRLRDLRATVGVDECSEIGLAWAPVMLAQSDGVRGYPKCNQPRGHIGDCVASIEVKWHRNGSGEFGV